MPNFWELSPDALGIKDKALTAAATTEYPSGFLDLRKVRQLMASLIIAQNSGAAGACKLSLDLYDEAKATLLSRIDLLTAIDTTDPRTEVVTFGRGVTPAKSGNGTIGASIGVLKVFGFAKLVLVVSTQNDGSGVTGSCRLLCGD